METLFGVGSQADLAGQDLLPPFPICITACVV